MKDPKSSKEGERETITKKIQEATTAVTGLVRSIAMAVEERIALEDQVRNVTRDTEYILDRIDDLTRDQQKKMLMAYKKFLEQNLSAVEYRMKRLG